VFVVTKIGDAMSPRRSRAALPSTADRRRAGLTIIELMLVLAAIGVLSALALPAYSGYRDRVRAADAATDIQGLSVMAKAFRAEFGSYPAQLNQAIQDVIEPDPWGNPYQYLAIAGGAPANMANTRKDKNLVPINSDFDLYSSGPDGQSQPPLAATVSRDDIVRASDGAFVGIAEEY
jgi:general secretion pathway protein G